MDCSMGSLLWQLIKHLMHNSGKSVDNLPKPSSKKKKSNLIKLDINSPNKNTLIE